MDGFAQRPIAALLSGARIINLYPLVLVPLFTGPRLGILTHIYSLRILEASNKSAINASDGGICQL